MWEFNKEVPYEIGDLVEWDVLTIHPNDIATLFKMIKDGQRLDNIPITAHTFIEKHTGFVINKVEMQLIVLDFIGKEETSFHYDDAVDKLRKVIAN